MTKYLSGKYSLESAGDAGFIVSGLMQSDGLGDRSRFVVTWPRPKERPVPIWLPRESDLWPPIEPLVEWPKWLPGSPSTGIPFSDKNSSKSAYWSETHVQIQITNFTYLNYLLDVLWDQCRTVVSYPINLAQETLPVPQHSTGLRPPCVYLRHKCLYYCLFFLKIRKLLLIIYSPSVLHTRLMMPKSDKIDDKVL